MIVKITLMINKENKNDYDDNLAMEVMLIIVMTK